MTTREFLVAVSTSSMNDELVTKAQELISALDAKNAKRKTTPTKEQKEASARRGMILGFFQSHPTEVFTRDQIAEVLGYTPGQVTAACKGLGDDIVKTEAKIGKSRRVVYQYNVR